MNSLTRFSVYVGKYKNRKVAISEFREHLSESESHSLARWWRWDLCLTFTVDIRELQLLAEFSHPNIVKFVSLAPKGCCGTQVSTDIPARYMYPRRQ